MAATRAEPAIGGAAIAASAAAVWLTLDARFLAHPARPAAQKADFILGPVFVGLYWRRVRPQSRFGPLLIGFGFVGAGLYREAVIELGTVALILT